MNLPFEISPSVSELMLHDEESGDTYIEFVAWYTNPTKYEVVRFTFKHCIGSRLYHMGGEGESNGSIGIVENSIWLKGVNTLQTERYPSSPDNFKHVKHYYFSGHDVSIEILAEGFEYESIRELENW